MTSSLSNVLPSSSDHTYSICSGTICANEESPDCMKRFDEIICEFMREQGIPGASVCLSLHGKVHYKQGYGISQTGQLMTSSAHFRVASISKILTAIGIMRLCEEGVCHLHQKVFGTNGILSQAPVPVACTSDMEAITMQDLLHHSAGWDRETDGDHVFWYQQPDHAQYINPRDDWSIVSHVLKYPLSFTPGSKHVYSNFGYLLLGLTIEKLTAMKYEDFIKDIMREIGVEDIQVGHAKQHLVDFREVKYYNNTEPLIDQSVFEGEGVVTTQYGAFPMENTGAYGGWVTSADHLVTLLDNLVATLNNEDSSSSCVLACNSIAQMLAKSSFCGEDEEAWYGLGLDVQDRGQSFGHTGSMDGTSTTVHHHKSGLTWSLLFNACSRDTDLDGLVKFALMSVHGLPLWYRGLSSAGSVDNLVISHDCQQCVTLLVSHDQLKLYVKVMVNAGYKISHLNVLSLHKQVLFTIVWERNTAKKHYGVVMDIVLDQLYDYLVGLGYKCIRIVCLECYIFNGRVLYICVYEIGAYSSQRVYSIRGKRERCEQRHEDIITMYRTEGYELVSQSMLVEENTEKLLITAVFEKVSTPCVPVDQRLWLHVPVEEFVEQLAKYTSNRHKLDYLQFYTCPDIVRVGAVWSPCRPNTDRKYHPCRHKSCGINVYQRHNVSKYGFLFELRETMKTNLRVLFISAYVCEGVINLATIWKASCAKSKRSKKKGSHAKKVMMEIENGLKNTTDLKINCSQNNSNIHVFSKYLSDIDNMDSIFIKDSNNAIEKLDIRINILELIDGD